MDTKIYVIFQNKTVVINITPYFTKFIQDIQKNFGIDNKNLNDYRILAQVEFNDKSIREYPINSESSYRNIMLGNYLINYIKIEKKETPKIKYANQKSNNSIKSINSINKNNNENTSKELNNNQSYNELKKYVDKELNILKNEIKEIKDNIKNIFTILKELQNNYISNVSTTPSTINSTKNATNNNYNNINNENSNSLSKGISKSIVFNKNNEILNKNNDYNINKEQSIRNINIYNSVTQSSKNNMNKNNNYKALFNLNEKKFPVVIKSQLNNDIYKNLEIKIKNIGLDLPAQCKIKSLNNNFIKIDTVYINNGKPIKYNEEITVNLTIKFGMLKYIKQGFYDIQICIFNELNKDINIISDEKIRVQIIDSEKNIVDNKKVNNNYNLISNEVSAYNLFDNRNMNYLNDMNRYNNSKNVSGSFKNSSNIYINNKRTTFQ